MLRKFPGSPRVQDAPLKGSTPEPPRCTANEELTQSTMVKTSSCKLEIEIGVDPEEKNYFLTRYEMKKSQVKDQQTSPGETKRHQ